MSDEIRLRAGTKRAIREIGGDDGFWRMTTEHALQTACKRLIRAGVPANDAVEIIAGVFGIASEEYGD